MKSQDKSEKSIFEHIKQSPRRVSPHKTKKFESTDGERMTWICYGSDDQNSHTASADKWMEEAGKNPNLLIENNCWHFILPWLENPEPDLVRFWRNFDRDIATSNRRKALNGSGVENRINEQRLIRIVQEYQELSIQGWGLDSLTNASSTLLASVNYTDKERDNMLTALKERMADWVMEAVWNDNQAPKRLHEILTKKKTSTADFSTEPSVNGRIFNAFARLLVANWNLPTKKAVRNGAGFGDECEDGTAAARAFKFLGIQGLPEA